MNRRTFIRNSALATALLPFGLKTYGKNPALDLDVKIQKIVCYRVKYTRPRIVAGNSKYKLAGGGRHDWMIALFADNGIVGIGSAPRYGKPSPSDFPVGKTVGDLLGKYQKQTAQEIGTTALWDLAGKTLKKPVYKLLGGHRKPEGIQVYDGSIYMEELINRDANSAYRNPNAPYGNRPSWKDIFKEAIDVSRAHGHDFVKVKIGRGSLHLDRVAGNIQDAAVLRHIRDYAGETYKIGVDANDGYRLEDTLWLLKEHGDLNLSFIEEMFPEDLEKYQTVKEVIRSHKLSTKIADGENWKTPTDPGVPELIHSGVIDVLQGDMRMFQIEGILKEAELAQKAKSPVLIAPHNWGCEFAFYVMIHMGNVIPNYYGAEHDVGTINTPIYNTEGYKINNGRCFAPEAPGFGVELITDKLNDVEIVYQFG